MINRICIELTCKIRRYPGGNITCSIRTEVKMIVYKNTLFGLSNHKTQNEARMLISDVTFKYSNYSPSFAKQNLNCWNLRQKFESPWIMLPNYDEHTQNVTWYSREVLLFLYSPSKNQLPSSNIVYQRISKFVSKVTIIKSDRDAFYLNYALYLLRVT